jgi:plasmid stabilization system protein ParE
MLVTFHEEARAELLEAARYYDERGKGLGHALIEDVEQAVQELSESPLSCPTIGTVLRRRIVRRFPYSLLYVVETERIVVMAVAHQKRRPGYWKYRLVP